jgi:hypothetical protein
MSAEHNETTTTTLPLQDEAKPQSFRFMLARLLALLLPGSGECRSLTSEEEIIACMAIRHPTLFIS